MTSPVPPSRRPPEDSRQIVHVESGFGYGAIGADIHVFTGGLPLYLLANWQPAPPAPAEFLRELPSRILNARRAVVPFTGREDELSRLRQWRDSTPRLAARWLYGPSGQGKTRLADQFAAESATAGWKVVTAFHGPDADPIEPGSQDLRPAGAAGLLMLVDYADRWRLTNLTWLLKNALLHQSGLQTRILMLGRTANAWPAIRAVLDSHQARTSTHPLEPLPSETEERGTMFAAARDSFAEVYELPDATGIRPPGPLDAADFGLTLAVHMAALVAVDAHATGTFPPADMAHLTVYLLDREQLHWARLYSDGTNATAGGNQYTTPPEVMNRTVFTAVLTGSLTRPTGTAVLEALGLPAPVDRVITDHAVCYPPADLARDTVLEPLYPDRLAEDFLALTLPGHASDYPAQPWAGRIAPTLLARSPDGAPATWTPRALTFLASAAERWPHLGPRHLYPLLRADPQLAVAAGSPALSALAELDDIDVALLESIAAHFPRHHHTDLDTGIAHLSVRLTRYQLAREHSPVEHARLHFDLRMRLQNAGLHQQALTEAEEALALYRRLAEENPGRHAHDLAAALGSHAASLASLGRWEECLAAVEQAEVMYRTLVQERPGVYDHDFAVTLGNRSMWLSRMGRREEAVAIGVEAVEVFRQLTQGDQESLAQGNQESREAELANALSNLAYCLSQMGRLEKALQTEQQAVTMREQLTRRHPALYEPDLANSLAMVGMHLAQTGRPEEALSVMDRVLEVFQRLAERNPDYYEPELARTLGNRGVFLSDAGRHAEAVASSREAVEIMRRTVKRNPAAHERELAACLSNLAGQLAGLGRWDEALDADRQALAVQRRLARQDLAAFGPELARSLLNLGHYLTKLGRPREAVEACEESADIFDRLAQENPAAFGPELATSFGNLGVSLSAAGRVWEALAVTEQAVTIWQRLARELPDAFLPGLAMALASLGGLLSRVGRQQEAVEATERAAGIIRPLAERNPAAHEPLLAQTLMNLGNSLSGLRRHAEARAVAEETVGLLRRLAEQNRDAHEQDLAGGLVNLGNRLSEMGEHQDALAATREAVDLLRKQAAENAPAHEPALALALYCFARARAEAGAEPAEALEAIDQSIALDKRLAASTRGNGRRAGPLLATVYGWERLRRRRTAAKLRRALVRQHAVSQDG